MAGVGAIREATIHHQQLTGGKMDNTQTFNHKLETLAWGALFLWWGITELFRFPNGMDAVGFGLIFLGVNAVRALKRIPTRNLTTILGIFALAWGVLDLARSILHLPLELHAEFAILLIVLGVIVLAQAATNRKRMMEAVGRS
jgi:hypothetical protein